MDGKREGDDGDQPEKKMRKADRRTRKNTRFANLSKANLEARGSGVGSRTLAQQSLPTGVCFKIQNKIIII